MNHAIHDHQPLFLRACLESAPEGRRPERAAFGGAGARPGSIPLHFLKQRLLQAALGRTADPAVHKQLCGAANIAAELVWNTASPALLFPCLFEELAQAIFDRKPEAELVAA